MLLINGLFISEQLTGPLDGHTVRVLRVGVGHDSPDVMLFGGRQHATRAFSAPVGVVVGQLVQRLVTVSLRLLKQLVEHIVLLRRLFLDLVDELIHIFVLRGQRGVATRQRD